MSKSSASCSSSSSGTPPSTAPTTSFPTVSPEDYSHSPVHYAVVLRDYKTLSRIISSLPKFADPAQIHSESDSLSQEQVADKIASTLDHRDVPNRETPLHLAVRLNDLLSAKLLAGAGADISLQNSSGWNPLQESLCQRSSKEISLTLLKSHHRAAWAKWRRRLPRLVSALRKMRDFYMEISLHFESSVIPFIGKIAPSDTYKIWKVDGNLRADTTLAGFDGLKMQRADQSFLFYGDGHDHHQGHEIPPGSLLVLNRDENKIFDAFENAGGPMSESDVAGFCSQTSVYRPGMDVTNAELISRTNWRRQEKMESVGDWKAKVYDINNVVFSFRSRKVLEASPDAEQILPLELDEDEDGFLVAENPDFGIVTEENSRRRHSSFVRDDREWFTAGRKSVDFIPKPEQRRKSTAVPPLPRQHHRPPPPILIHSRSSRKSDALRIEHPPPLPPHPAIHLPRQQVKEKEYVKSLRPAVWLTEQFPLKTEELLPLLDILASKVKAVRRMREVLTTKFPPGTFPVKVAIPVVPTVRVVITFTKFVELQSADEFFTPFSSPRHFGSGGRGSCSEEEKQSESPSYSLASSSAATSSSWMRRSASHSSSMLSLSKPKKQPQKLLSSQSCSQQLDADSFAIPEGFTWTSIMDDKSRKLKKSKSVRKSR